MHTISIYFLSNRSLLPISQCYVPHGWLLYLIIHQLPYPPICAIHLKKPVCASSSFQVELLLQSWHSNIISLTYWNKKRSLHHGWFKSSRPPQNVSQNKNNVRHTAILVIYLYNKNCAVQIPQIRCKGENIRASILPDLNIPPTSLQV